PLRAQPRRGGADRHRDDADPAHRPPDPLHGGGPAELPGGRRDLAAPLRGAADPARAHSRPALAGVAARGADPAALPRALAEPDHLGRRMRAARAILSAGVVAGILDITAAVVLTLWHGGRPLRMLQGIASGLLGRAAFEGGLR